jgi:hypothetical protein
MAPHGENEVANRVNKITKLPPATGFCDKKENADGAHHLGGRMMCSRAVGKRAH